MPNLIDIPTTVNALVTFFAMGGADAAIEVVKGMLTNASLKVADFHKLKDELLELREVAELAQQVQQDSRNTELQKQLRESLTRVLEQQQTAVQVQGDIKAEKGSVAAAVISGGSITITNKNNDD